jgi:glucokinase
MSRPVLIADIGATNSRLALTGADGKPRAVRAVANATVPDLESLLADALAAAGRGRPQAAVLGIAGPVEGDRVTVINRGWTFSQRALARRLKLERLVVVNDFAALACALPALRRPDLIAVGTGHGNPKQRLLACGPGSGFGSALLIAGGARPQVLASEAGHMRLGAATADEARVIAHFMRDSGPVIVEQVLSGSGLARLHTVLCGERKSSEAVASAARAGNAAALATAEFFLRLYGRIAGDLCLAYNARAVFLAGGVTQGLAPIIPRSSFRAAFEEHAPYTERMALIPVHIVVREEPGLLGAAQIGRHFAR